MDTFQCQEFRQEDDDEMSQSSEESSLGLALDEVTQFVRDISSGLSVWDWGLRMWDFRLGVVGVWLRELMANVEV